SAEQCADAHCQGEQLQGQEFASLSWEQPAKSSGPGQENADQGCYCPPTEPFLPALAVADFRQQGYTHPDGTRQHSKDDSRKHHESKSLTHQMRAETAQESGPADGSSNVQPPAGGDDLEGGVGVSASQQEVGRPEGEEEKAGEQTPPTRPGPGE